MSSTNSASIPAGEQKASQLAEDVFESQPIVHKAVWKCQLNDDNELYLSLWELAQKLHNSDEQSREPFLSDEPINPPHTAGDEQYYVGLKSRRSGTYLDGSRLYEYTLGLYNSDETRPNTAAKATLEIKRRSFDMTTSDSDAFEWAKDDDGERHEGTYMELQASYVQDHNEAHEVATAYLDALLGQETTQQHYDPIPATEYIGQLEAHYRYSSEYERGVVHALQNSFFLMEIQGCGIESRAEAKRGRYGIKRVDANPGAFDTIGHPAPDAMRDDDGEAEYGVMLKTYNTLNVHQRSDDDPLSEPKVEAACKGTIHTRHLDTVTDYLGGICAAHLRYTGASADSLVADDHFAPSGSLTVQRPTLDARTDMLQEYQNNPDLRHEVQRQLRHRQAESYRDLILSLYDERDDKITYEQLSRRTGLHKETMRKYCRHLVEAGILRKIPGRPVFVTWRTPQVKETVEDELKGEGKTPAELRDERENRKEEREKKKLRDRFKEFFKSAFNRNRDTGDDESDNSSGNETERTLRESERAAEGHVPLPALGMDIYDAVTVLQYGDVEAEDVALR